MALETFSSMDLVSLSRKEDAMDMVPWLTLPLTFLPSLRARKI